MVKNAWNFILPALVLAVSFALLGNDGYCCAWVLCALAVLFAAFCAYFFRSPERAIPSDPNLVVSPADGKVIAIEPIDDPWLGKGMEIRIFLNVFNVHVQRNPFTTPTTVEGTRYFAGKFLAASVPKASLENEQHWFRLASGKRRIMVKQIAGLIARRILCDIHEGQALTAGQRIGIIRFGSRTDLYLPEGTLPLVAVGQRMIGGETVIAELRPTPAPVPVL